MQYDSNDVPSSGDSHRLAADDPLIEQRPWGFFAFVVSALTVVLIGGRQPADQTRAKTKATLAPVIALAAAAPLNSDVRPKNLAPQSETAVPLTIESDEVMLELTQFVLKRSQAVSGLARMRWAARSGTADAAIDFSDASGTAVMADRQRQVALYVPLRNDLLKEGDETFKVCLHSPEHARPDRLRCGEATIRDDD